MEAPLFAKLPVRQCAPLLDLLPYKAAQVKAVYVVQVALSIKPAIDPQALPIHKGTVAPPAAAQQQDAQRLGHCNYDTKLHAASC
jgi:hypothetical protein